MSQENIEIVHRIYERWGRGDFKAGIEELDPFAVMVMRPEFPDSGAYLGREGFAEYMKGFLEPWDRITIEAEEIVAEAGDSVIVAVRQSGVGGGSGANTELRYFHAWSFRGGRAIRFETIRERAEALEAIGLSA